MHLHESGLYIGVCDLSGGLGFGLYANVRDLGGRLGFGLYAEVRDLGNGLGVGLYANVRDLGGRLGIGLYAEVRDSGNGLGVGLYANVRDLGGRLRFGLYANVRDLGGGLRVGLYAEVRDLGNGLGVGLYANVRDLGGGLRFGLYADVRDLDGGLRFGLYADVRDPRFVLAPAHIQVIHHSFAYAVACPPSTTPLPAFVVIQTTNLDLSIRRIKSAYICNVDDIRRMGRIYRRGWRTGRGTGVLALYGIHWRPGPLSFPVRLFDDYALDPVIIRLVAAAPTCPRSTHKHHSDKPDYSVT
ncbi:hypothetical protein [Mycetohabitans sp. B4]|uniref:hypothetical protein n=1 Tax=Mycetohabitans sp. B4 TaxID=2841842 RepID=UPI001F41ADD7|nr:hypothetical protein [Mycetohabitans sp. B4]MCG1018800.1 hypothetical protein [Mycetohabitans sp. B4]